MKRQGILSIFAALSLTVLAGCTAIETNQPYNESDQQQNNDNQEENEQITENETPNPNNQSSEDKEDATPTYVQEVNGKQVITNPKNPLVLVNKTTFLPYDYKPELVVPNVPFYFDEVLPKKHMRPEAAKGLEQLFADAKQAQLNLVAASGYRSYQRQHQIYQAQINQVGKEKANDAVALPGQSEHQTGLAMDVTSPEMSYQLNETFEQTKEGQWLKNNAYKYGFIIRYPKGKEATTGYQYEPWHLRYVGNEAAQVIHTQGITLEEYVDAVPVDQQQQAKQPQ